MMTSFYNQYELDKGKTVADKDLNEVLQAVREFDCNFYVLERKFETKKRFRKPVEHIRYIVLNDLGCGECQVINFCQDTDWSINSYVSKSYVYTFLCGLESGYKRGIKKQNQ